MSWISRLALLAIVATVLVALGFYGQLSTVRVLPPDAPPLVIPTSDDPRPFPHDALDAVLRRFVDAQGRVDYGGLTNDRTELERYMVALGATSPHKAPAAFASDADRLAYWINAYNAIVLYAVTERPALTSVHDEKYDFFGLTRYLVGGEAISLYTLENEIVRRQFEDPRIHVALNCASVGCPRLPREAFVPDRLEAQLAREARAFCADPDKVRLRNDTVKMSQIFQWYAADFEVVGGPVAFCRKWGREDLPVDAHVEFLPYDWSLNAQPGQRENRDRRGPGDD